MDPYTPRTRPGGRKKNLGLSAKEYTKVRVSLPVMYAYYDMQTIDHSDHRHYRFCAQKQTTERRYLRRS
jgi:hypothetical protein